MPVRIVGLFLLFFSPCIVSSQQDSAKADWSFAASGYYYFIPDDENTLTVIGTADHKKLHLETRFNYEDQNTGSVFAGWRWETGGKLRFEAVPMLGIAFGNTNGIVPALELSVAWKRFDYYSETEYVIDFSGGTNNFFYVWGELGFSPLENLRTGISYQRTKLYQSDFDVQRGIFAEYSFWKLTAGVHYFNPFAESNFVIVSVSIDF